MDEKISYTAVLYLVWQDELFTWNASEYGDMEDVFISADKIWVPQVMNVNAMEDIDKLSEDWHSIKVQSDGLIVYTIGAIFTSSCAVDVEYYPWDEQVCSFLFQPSSYEPEYFQLKPYFQID